MQFWVTGYVLAREPFCVAHFRVPFSNEAIHLHEPPSTQHILYLHPENKTNEIILLLLHRSAGT